MGTLSPNPWDLPLSGLHVCARQGGKATPVHAGIPVGAPVASLRSRILRRGEHQYMPGAKVIAGPITGRV
jgi:hypothetical protein